MARFIPNETQTAMLIAAAENGRADEKLDDYLKYHNANNGVCPGKCCKP